MSHESHEEEAALDRLAALGEDSEDSGSGDRVDLDSFGTLGDISGQAAYAYANRQQLSQARFARSRLCRHRREQAEAEEEEQEENTWLNDAFNIRRPCGYWTATDVSDMVFDRQPSKTLNVEAADRATQRRTLQNIRLCTLYRYIVHRGLALERFLTAAAPAALLVVSVGIKWDETEQVVQYKWRAPQPPGSDRNAAADVATIGTKHVYTSGVFFKTSQMASPAYWANPPLLLQRTTANCIWAAWQRSVPFGPWGDLPGTDQASWLVMAFTADEASSNKKAFAQAVTALTAKRPNVVIVFCPCLLHVLHRSVVPILKGRGSINAIYRVAHVLKVGTYWAALLQASRQVAAAALVIVHDKSPPAASHTSVAEHVLFIALGDGSPLELWPKALRRKYDMLLQVFCGDWSTDTVRYTCRTNDCPGGARCRAAALQEISQVLAECVFRRVQIPSLSRWWKFTPMAQQILLGCALHNLWGRAAPKHVKGAVASQLDTVAQPLGDEVEGDENAWRDLHSWRVSRTCEFFSQPDTVSHLVVVLQSLRPAHAVMAWIMKHTSQRPSDAKQHKLAAVRQFVEPATSPVFKALARGRSLARYGSLGCCLGILQRARAPAVQGDLARAAPCHGDLACPGCCLRAGVAAEIATAAVRQREIR